MIAKTRIDGWSKGKVLSLVLGLILWIAYGLSLTLSPDAISSRDTVTAASKRSGMTDLKLYEAISERVAAGDDYYSAAAQLHRQEGFPLKPFFTMRLPTLATIVATLGLAGSQALLWSLLAITLMIWWQRIKESCASAGQRLAALLFLTTGLFMVGLPNLVVLHDAWAGLLVTLALGLHGRRRIWPSMLAVAAAILIRETIVPIAGLFMFLALIDKQWKVAAVWAALIAALLAVIAVHAQAVMAVTLPSDGASQGWLKAGGWAFALQAWGETTVLRALPEWTAAILVPLAMAGWFSWADKTGRAVSLALMGYTILFIGAGRLENFYWGLWVSPILLTGLAFVPQAAMAAVAAFKPLQQPLDSSAPALP
jgi:hypothetical protein